MRLTEEQYRRLKEASGDEALPGELRRDLAALLDAVDASSARHAIISRPLNREELLRLAARPRHGNRRDSERRRRAMEVARLKSTGLPVTQAIGRVADASCKSRKTVQNDWDGDLGKRARALESAMKPIRDATREWTLGRRRLLRVGRTDAELDAVERFLVADAEVVRLVVNALVRGAPVDAVTDALLA